MLTLHGLLSLLILMIRHVNADGQLYVYILCVFLLTMPVNLLINLRSPRDYVGPPFFRSSVRSFVRA